MILMSLLNMRTEHETKTILDWTVSTMESKTFVEILFYQIWINFNKQTFYCCLSETMNFSIAMWKTI